MPPSQFSGNTKANVVPCVLVFLSWVSKPNDYLHSNTIAYADSQAAAAERPCGLFLASVFLGLASDNFRLDTADARNLFLFLGFHRGFDALNDD